MVAPMRPRASVLAVLRVTVMVLVPQVMPVFVVTGVRGGRPDTTTLDANVPSRFMVTLFGVMLTLPLPVGPVGTGTHVPPLLTVPGPQVIPPPPPPPPWRW